ncbi:MAG: BACON domain-containing protein [Bacteroidales bacterium]|nr:BACON domain-containing protein [Bacteroidales bacterium]
MKNLTKKLWRSALVLALLPVALWSCTDPEQPVPDAQFTLNPPELTLPAEGGQASFSLDAPVDWKASTTADWITIAPSQGDAAKVTVTLKASANETGETRSTTVTVSAASMSLSASVKVTQPSKQAPPPPTPEVVESDELVNIVGASVGATVKFKAMAYAVSVDGFVVDDGTTPLFVYTGSEPSIDILGTKIQVSGKRTQIRNIPCVEATEWKPVTDGNHNGQPSKGQDITGNLSSFNSDKMVLTSFTGKFDVTNKANVYTLTTATGSAYTFTLFMPQQYVSMVAENMAGMTVTVNAYYFGKDNGMPYFVLYYFYGDEPVDENEQWTVWGTVDGWQWDKGGWQMDADSYIRTAVVTYTEGEEFKFLNGSAFYSLAPAGSTFTAQDGVTYELTEYPLNYDGSQTTIDARQYGGSIKLPEAGQWTLTVDISTRTFTATKYDPSVKEPAHVAAIDKTGWDNMYLYVCSASGAELCGARPGVEPLFTQDYEGYPLRYFEIPAGFAPGAYTLVFSDGKNNAVSRQNVELKPGELVAFVVTSTAVEDYEEPDPDIEAPDYDEETIDWSVGTVLFEGEYSPDPTAETITDLYITNMPTVHSGDLIRIKYTLHDPAQYADLLEQYGMSMDNFFGVVSVDSIGRYTTTGSTTCSAKHKTDKNDGAIDVYVYGSGSVTYKISNNDAQAVNYYANEMSLLGMLVTITKVVLVHPE